MDGATLGAALALANSIPGTAVSNAVSAANRAEAAALAVEQNLETAEAAALAMRQKLETIERFDNTSLIMVDGKLCVEVVRE